MVSPSNKSELYSMTSSSDSGAALSDDATEVGSAERGNFASRSCRRADLPIANARSLHCALVVTY